MKLLYIVCLLFSTMSSFALGVSAKTVDTENYIQNQPRYYKPGAAVSLVYSQVNLDIPGIEYLIDISLDAEYAEGELTASVTASEGLHLVEGDLNPTIMLDGSRVILPFSVIAEVEGRYYIYVNTQVEVDGVSLSRALTFIVQVGGSEKEKAVPDSLEKSLRVKPSPDHVIH